MNAYTLEVERMAGIKELDDSIDGYVKDIIEMASEVLSIPAIAPESDGDGEMEKAKCVARIASSWGFDRIEYYNSPDPRVAAKERPNLLLTLKGSDPARPPIWIFSHIDVVPPGDLNKWSADPWKLRVEGDRMIARGVEDNGQGLFASMFAAKALLESGTRPRRDVKLFLVADEEVGSAKGMVYLIKQHRELFGDGDLYVVPDAGDPDGAMIEVAEKSIMWVKMRTFGKQVHASVPSKGVNANLAAMRFLVSLYDELHERYPDMDDMYDHPISSFEPTKKEANVPNVNTIPGEDVQYIDCRIMPAYDPAEVLEFIRMRALEFGESAGVTFEFCTVQMEKAAPPTPADHPLVGMLKDAVMEVYGTEAKPVGIGGGTCAAILRRAGLPSVVWGRLEDTAHMPDESALLSNYLGDAKVFLRLFLS